jgi:hypothetical protein
MDTSVKEYDVVTLEDGKEYFIIDEIDIDGVRYVYLTTDDIEQKFRVRKVQKAGNIEMYVGLDSDQEFDKAMLYFTKNHQEDLK